MKNFIRHATLRASSKKVIDAFILKKPLENQSMTSTGKELSSISMGGQLLAKWVGRKIAFVGLESSRTVSSIVRYLTKKAGHSMVTFDYDRKGFNRSIHFQTGGDVNGPQYDGYVYARLPWRDNQFVGQLTWTEYQDEYSVRMIEVLPEYRRTGIGKALMEYFMKDQKITKSDINTGMRTPDGSKFWDKLSKGMEHPENLRAKVIKLAHENPKLRKHLVPILKEAE